MFQFKRKVAFSGKAKKDQLKTKRNRKRTQNPQDTSTNSSEPFIKFNQIPKTDSRPNKYALKFFRESDELIKARKEQASNSLIKRPENELDIDGSKEFFSIELDFPKRPPWNYNMTKGDLELQENQYFTEYLHRIRQYVNAEELSYFELNLETWRQFWRVLEMSDVILFIVDIRYASAMFPPNLYTHVTETLQKHFILVLNKIDLVDASLVTAWKHYFEQNYPLLRICLFTSLPSYNLVGDQTANEGTSTTKLKKRRGRQRMAVEGTQQLYEICESLVKNKVDLNDWRVKIEEEMREHQSDDVETEVDETLLVPNDTSYYDYKKYSNQSLTIGCIGQPNVGKSSLINAIKGRKVVSVSKTPGHTKYFQTIYITRNVVLCDCPGLVFPSKVPKPLQVLMGSFPISQLREPYTTIRYIAERIDLVKLLNLTHPTHDDEWSPLDICDAWAVKRGFMIARVAKTDLYRAANNLLQMALAGQINFAIRPPNYTQRKDFWENHADVKQIRSIQAGSRLRNSSDDNDENYYDDDDQSDNESSSESLQEDNSSADSEEVTELTNKFSMLSDDS